ncbi:unnamed protein product [Pseudo-nitzschia multistriata]|uniref:Uncharacterized protein n=1 Tax=Pseudo-nitzschia multistriata TaxID=183589 RepID=A0A448Z9M2_9STRA|nr:unnamed protein product [Pseudo-nitzschia multistriata]
MSSSPKKQPPSPLPSPLHPCACSVFVATSSDGYIADRDHKVDWLNDLRESHPLPEGDDGGFADFLESVDAIVMGRVTSPTTPFWDSGSNARVRAVSGDPASVLATVAGEAEGSPARTAVTRVCVYVDGGRCIRSFLDAGLVTSATITRVPVTLGDGVPLFSEEQASRLRETRSVTLANGFVQTTFEVV